MADVSRPLSRPSRRSRRPLAYLAGFASALALLSGAVAPRCVPAEPEAPLCTADEDCVLCVHASTPRSAADCACPLCPTHPMTAVECERNTTAFARHCGPDDWPDGAFCPIPRCLPPPPVHCDDGVCEVSPPPCGDPLARERYAACTAAGDAVSCVAAGGSWQRVGLAPFEECQCPTGQGQCPCDTPDDCLSACVAPLPDFDWDCADAVSTCAAHSIVVGCLCLFDNTGEAMGICID